MLDFSYHRVEKTVLPHQPKERENDLTGNYFALYRKAPEYQFGKRELKKNQNFTRGASRSRMLYSIVQKQASP